MREHDEIEQSDRQDKVEMRGVVVEALPASTFKVSVNDGALYVIANLSGRMKQNRIKVLVADEVLLETSPYDLTRGRITRRL